jgi:membrane protease subunit HflC
MRKEREKIAQRYRSAGEAEKLVIESQARRQSEEILAKAGTDAARIRGEGEAEALRIRNNAHSRDPEFYQVLRTLESYKKILNQKTTFVLSASSGLLKLLTEGVPPDLAAPKSVPPAEPASPGTAAKEPGP